MRELFAEYYAPTDEDIEQAWRAGVISFDTNVLLNLYRYTEATRDTLLDILTQLQAQLWLTHQAAQEYHNQRLNVITQQQDAYDDLQKNYVDKNLRAILNRIASHPKHVAADMQHELTTIVAEALQRASAVVQAAKARHPQYFRDDPILRKLTLLFAERVGSPCPAEEIPALHARVQERYDAEVPPGYADVREKAGTNRYGDGVLWLQLVDYASGQKRPVIFITDDRKEDWWLRHRGMLVGPRRELTREMCGATGAPFLMYQPEGFIAYAQHFLKLQDQSEAIAEVQEVGQQDDSPATQPAQQGFAQHPGTAASRYAWSEFWAWVRDYGYRTREALDAALGEPTKDMNPTEIRRALEEQDLLLSWTGLSIWGERAGFPEVIDIEMALGHPISAMAPALIRREVIAKGLPAQAG